MTPEQKTLTLKIEKLQAAILKLRGDLEVMPQVNTAIEAVRSHLDGIHHWTGAVASALVGLEFRIARLEDVAGISRGPSVEFAAAVPPAPATVPASRIDPSPEELVP